MSRVQVAMIGAGLGGLTCAAELHAAGFQVHIFDKSRGLGGRMATRRAEMTAQGTDADENVPAAFDHGAQYFTARDDAFRQRVEQWREAGVAAEWRGKLGVSENQTLTASPSDVQRWVGAPTMTAIAKHVADSLPPVDHRRVASILKAPHRGWQLKLDDGDVVAPESGSYDVVLSNAPAPQTAAIFLETPLAEACEACEIAPCWAMMAAFVEPLACEFDGVFMNDNPVLSWAARNNSKPLRPAAECWVAHASGDWTREHIDAKAPEAAELLLAELFAALQITDMPKPQILRAHRWLYALPTKPLEARCVWNPEWNVGACGDWCGGPRVEGAFLSGLALAEAVMGAM